ncbi:TonB-dependent receptor [Bradyrhizobium sp. SYSU BS000235]|uniref:TonB-dependent receptor n=1 Tax=Bradyrhizobium sp. SYSU BS000235 TaxID=3411332 RepID=UPI003C773D1D
MIHAIRMQRQARSTSISRSILMSASYLVLSVTLWAPDAMAQAAAENQSGATALPPVVVATHKPKARRRGTASRRRTDEAAAKPKPEPLPDTQDSRTGTAGYVSNSTSVATKTNTPLINIPQSVSVLTKNFIKDQAPLGLTDVTRYVPGVAVHQGEGNRDELVIRGVDSSANFFVNGIRDDVQIFRDLYNTQSIEIVKGPSALTFGRGAGGGLLNRTLKEADGTRIYEATAQAGSYGDRRISIDAGQAVNENVAARFNAFYEGSETFRDFGNLERYGINPTLTLKPNDTTKIKLSYEYYHDERTADRGNPSQALAIPGGATRFNPTTPFAPNGDLTAFFGSPTYNVAKADVQTTMAVIEHDFENGLTVKNSAVYADYNKFYQNVYPGGAVNSAQTAVNLNAYQHWTDRDNAINQTDFTYKASTGSIRHTLGFGTEFGRQTGIDQRNTGIFASTGTNSFTANPFDPTFFGTIDFIHHPTATNTDGVTSADSNSKYALNTQSAYVRDQIEITRWLQVIGGVRYDRFDMSAVDRNTGIQRGRVDEKLSPQAAIIVKPVENLSVYGAYSVSYLPASGDQFSALNDGTLILEPQKFENTEVGVKWNITPKLQFTSAIYELNRTNQPIPDPVRGSPFVLPNGASKVRGFETALNGYVTDAWQSSIGYAYTDARIAKDLTQPTAVPPVLAGNRVQLVPYNQFSWWNKYQIDPIWGAGLGIIYFSDSYAASDDTVRLPGFVRVDAALYVKINETWRGQLNIENIFDKGYWASADGNNNISPGQPRTFKVSATAKF